MAAPAGVATVLATNSGVGQEGEPALLFLFPVTFLRILILPLMKTLLVVTHVDFWRKGAGHRSRLSALLQYVRGQVEITVVYAGTLVSKDAGILKESYPWLHLVALEPNRVISFKEHGELFEEFMKEKHFDIALIEYIEMSFVIPMLGDQTLTILDTHDLVSDRIQSFAENGIRYNGIMLSEEEELEIFNCFDKVLLINQKDYEKVAARIGFDTAMLVPHAATLNKRLPRSTVKNIGFVGSEYIPNVAAINWFLKNVWPHIGSNFGLTLNIYGNVAQHIQSGPHLASNVQIHGFVNDLSVAYDTCDIIINPVSCGAGLKIKNVEALAGGLPLITSTHGSEGLGGSNGESFLVCDTADEFVAAIELLATDFEFRRQLGENAYALASAQFSPTRCYQELMGCLLEKQLTL